MEYTIYYIPQKSAIKTVDIYGKIFVKLPKLSPNNIHNNERIELWE